MKWRQDTSLPGGHCGRMSAQVAWRAMIPDLPALSDLTRAQARALLEWQVEMGAREAIGDEPVDRYALAERAKGAPAAKAATGRAGSAPAPDRPAAPQDPVAAAEAAAHAAQDLAGLEAAIGAFTLCDLRRGARSTVFAAGRPDSAVMVVGEAPGREEDRAGHPFAGTAGAMLDRMFAAIGLSVEAEDRAQALYLVAPMPWRPPSRAPTNEEIAMLAPFLKRHVELAAPRLVVCMGALPARILLDVASVARARGGWREAEGRPALAIHHPATLMRRPELKREAWADLLMLRAKLQEDLTT